MRGRKRGHASYQVAAVIGDTLARGDLARSPTGEVGTVVKLSAHYVTLRIDGVQRICRRDQCVKLGHQAERP